MPPKKNKPQCDVGVAKGKGGGARIWPHGCKVSGKTTKVVVIPNKKKKKKKKVMGIGGFAELSRLKKKQKEKQKK